MAAPADMIWADLPATHLRMYAAARGNVPNWIAKERGELMTDIAAADAGATDGNSMTKDSADVAAIRAFGAVVLGYTCATYTRSQVVARIHAALNPPPGAVAAAVPGAIDAPLEQPRDIVFRSLETLEDQAAHQNWVDDIQTKMQARGCWDVLAEQIQGNAIHPTPRQEQLLLLAFAGVKNILGADILKQANALNHRTAAAVMAWVGQKVNELGTALERKAYANLMREGWRNSKLGLSSWVGILRSYASETGPNLPAGRPRENAIRGIIFRNVGALNPDCAQIIRTHKQREVTDPGFSVDELVTELTKVMVESENNGEAQCRAFSAEIYTDEQLQQQCAALLAQKTEAESRAKRAEAAADSENALWAQNSSKGGWNNFQKGNGKQQQNGKGGKYCYICAKFYSEKGLKAEKDAAIRSHDAQSCRFKSSNNVDNKNQRNTNGKGQQVRKFDKKKGGGKKSGKKGNK